MEKNVKWDKEEIFLHAGRLQYAYHARDWISKGGSGCVYRARLTAESKVLSNDKAFAVKVVQKTPEKMSNGVQLRSRWKKVLALNHTHLIAYHKVTIHKAPGGACVEFLMDYVHKGENLAQYLAKIKDKKLDQTEAVCYALQIADGLAYLHEKNIINGDVKPENVLVKYTENNHKTLLITDLDDVVHKFGQLTTAKDISDLVGTYRYMSPEMMKKFIGDTTIERIGSKTDVWSLGCIIHKLANSASGIAVEWLYKGHSKRPIKTGKEDLDHHEYARLVINGWMPFISNSIPDSLASVIRGCFTVDSVERMSAEAVVYDLRETVNTLTFKRGAARFPDRCYCVDQLAPPASQKHWEDFDRITLGPEVSFGSSCEYSFATKNYFARGAFGTVYGARIAKLGDYSGPLVVAVKTVQFTHEGTNRIYKTRRWKKMQDKWKRLLTFRHNHLIAFHKVTVTKALGGSYIEFMMDLCAGRDLTKLLAKWSSDGSLPAQLTAVCYGMQIADGLQFLHNNHIIHGDLAPTSILIKFTKYRHHNLVIGDLDKYLQVHSDNASVRDLWEIQGTMQYMSPEMLGRFASTSDDPVDRKTDIWSLGCIVVDLANHVANHSEKWFYNRHTGQRVNLRSSPAAFVPVKVIQGYAPHVGDFVHSSLAKCIGQCLFRNPIQRISAGKLRYQFGAAVKAIVSSAPESMDGCLECMCCSFFPGSSDTTEIFVIFHYFSHVRASSNIRVQLFHPVKNQLHPISLPTPLLLKAFLQNPATFGKEIICHAKDVRPPKKPIVTYAWDLANKTCRTLYSDPALNMSSMVIMDNIVYFWNKFAVSSPLKSMDLSDGNVSALPTPAKMSEAKLAQYQSKIFCCANNGYDVWVVCYNTATGNWECVSDMPEARNGYALISLGLGIYVLGGSISDGNDLITSSTCIRLNMETQTWEPVSTLLKPRSHHCAFVSKDRIHVFGGVVDDALALSQTMERYDEQTNSWSAIELIDVDSNMSTLQNFTCTTICGPYKWPKSVKFTDNA